MTPYNCLWVNFENSSGLFWELRRFVGGSPDSSWTPILKPSSLLLFFGYLCRRQTFICSFSAAFCFLETCSSGVFSCSVEKKRRQRWPQRDMCEGSSDHFQSVWGSSPCREEDISGSRRPSPQIQPKVRVWNQRAPSVFGWLEDKASSLWKQDAGRTRVGIM